MRARGLKRYTLQPKYTTKTVAPHAGAWIETECNKQLNGLLFVAPHAGAWIETGQNTLCQSARSLSRPMRARGLKHIPVPFICADKVSRPMRARGLKQEILSYLNA